MNTQAGSLQQLHRREHACNILAPWARLQAGHLMSSEPWSATAGGQEVRTCEPGTRSNQAPAKITAP